MRGFEPYDEATFEKFWEDDPNDDLIPTPGFLSDLVLHMRGTEVPTIFTLWSGLFALSSILKREVCYQWHPNAQYANLYIIIVARPGLFRKSTMVDYGADLLEEAWKKISDPNARTVKKVNLVRGKTTPEALIEAMVPANRPILFKNPDGSIMRDANGNPQQYYPGSDTAIALTELALSVNNRSYSETMIENLLAFYDCHESLPVRTRSRGLEDLKKLYTTFIAAVTPDGFKESVPKVTMGDGFLSRTIIVYQENNPRNFSVPVPVPGAPSKDDLINRLAWIAENNIGVVEFNKNAREYYDEWYQAFRRRLQVADELTLGIRSRMDTNLRKLALLMKVQRYDISDKITIQDVKDALYLLDRTYELMIPLVSDLKADPQAQQINRVSRFIERAGEITRRELIRSSHEKAKMVNKAISKLHAQQKIEIILNGHLKSKPSSNSTEVYRWNTNLWTEKSSKSEESERPVDRG